jgi:hypothetical protein
MFTCINVQDLNPDWDQIIYVPVHSLKEASAFSGLTIQIIYSRFKVVLLECMDYQHLTKVHDAPPIFSIGTNG